MSILQQFIPSSISARYEVFLLFLWILLLPIVGFWGDFPLNDDWAYAYNVRYLVEEHRIVFSDWPAMTLIAQTVWGSLFCFVFGFSFTVLRLSTLVAAGLALRWWYRLLLELDFSPKMAFASSLLLLFNPFFFSLSYSFMTEIPFLTCCIAGFYAMVLFLKYHQTRYFIGGLLASMGAILIRQFGIVLPIGMGILYFGMHLHDCKNYKVWIYSALPFILILATLGVYNYWRASFYGFPEVYGQATSLLDPIYSGEWRVRLYVRTSIFSFYLGLFFLPLTISLFPNIWLESPQKGRLAIVAGAILTTIYYYLHWNTIPITNLFYNLGLGAELTRDTYWKTFLEPSASFLWTSIKIAGILGAGLLYLSGAAAFLSKQNTILQKSLQWGNLASSLLYISVLLLVGIYFDRYHLPLYPFVFLVLAPAVLRYFSWKNAYLGAIILTLYAFFSITATHDYLQFNRSRKQATDHLTKDLKISPNNIDGGFEFNGWLLHDTIGYNPHHPIGKSWWWVDKDDYTIAASPIQNYKPMDKIFIFNRWLSCSADTIFILEKPIPKKIDTLFCGMERWNIDSLQYNENQSFKPAYTGTPTGEKFLEGHYSLSLNNPKKHQYNLQYLFKNVGTKEEFRLRLWTFSKSKNTTDNGLLVLKTANSKDFYNQGAILMGEHNGWQQLEWRVYLPDSFETQDMLFYFDYPHQDSIWVDNLEINRIWY